jgi:hypothetical protein
VLFQEASANQEIDRRVLGGHVEPVRTDSAGLFQPLNLHPPVGSELVASNDFVHYRCRGVHLKLTTLDQGGVDKVDTCSRVLNYLHIIDERITGIVYPHPPQMERLIT